MRYILTLAVCAFALILSVSVADAEQIRLNDGRYLQGEVVEVRENGFVFRRTDTGGRIFLRWGQVDDGLKKRLTNQRDPDEDLDLEVMVEGARLELLDGTEYEGAITRDGNVYRVVNRDYPRGRAIQASDVADDGYITDIMIDAVVMMTEQEALALAESRREPIESAHQYYELARIADMLGLYDEAKDYVTRALSLNPDTQLEARLSEYDAQLDELIRQRGVLTALAAARQLARRHKYQTALDALELARTEYSPTDGVLARWESTHTEIDLDFTKYVIREWHRQLRPVARAKARESNLTVHDAIGWARREFSNEVMRRIAEAVGSSDNNDIRTRFTARFALESANIVRLSIHRASFGQDGFYQIVGGHLPVAGVTPAAPAPDPRGGGGRNPGRGGADRDRNVAPDSSTLRDAIDEHQFQRTPSADEIQDLLERLGGNREGGGANRGNEAPAVGRQDVSHLRVPNNVPSLTDWWDRSSAARRSSWLIAYYVVYGQTMRVVDLNDWNVRYK